MADWTPVVVAAITILGGGGMLGWAALRKSGREADKVNAEAAAVIVGGASDVVALLREEMDRLRADVEAERQEDHKRLDALESVVTAWDGWADRVLDILDRAVGMLTEEQRASLLPDVDHARETRPPRHSHQKHLVHRTKEGTP
jgi:hypothetical protein